MIIDMEGRDALLFFMYKVGQYGYIVIISYYTHPKAIDIT